MSLGAVGRMEVLGANMLVDACRAVHLVHIKHAKARLHGNMPRNAMLDTKSGPPGALGRRDPTVPRPRNPNLTLTLTKKNARSPPMQGPFASRTIRAPKKEQCARKKVS